MKLLKWDDLPEFMKCEEVKEYYNVLDKKRAALSLKRVFDVIVAVAMLIVLAIPMLIIAAAIKIDSHGPVFYRQERVTTYGKIFRIHKFRTMVDHADQKGSTVTVDGDTRITRVGSKLRNLRIDEIPQLIDVLTGDMSFVGTRPEAIKYVRQYTKKMNATLLLPAGITSEASIRYHDEAKLLNAADDVDKVYVEEILPEKMTINLQSLKSFSFMGEIKTMFRTAIAVLGKDYNQE